MTTTTTSTSMAFGPIQVAFDGTVLRPRPWTLPQAEWAAQLAGAGAGDGPMLELGCGAGHIGLAAAVLSGRPLVQVDRDPAACRWAAHNAAASGCAGRVEQRCGTVEEVLTPDERFPVVIADPPYVPTAEVDLYPEDPIGAIDGGADGLDVVRSFLVAACRHLTPEGSVVVQLRGIRQVAQLETWLAHPVSPGLVLLETRSSGELRALARLGVRAGAA
jgi:methylase of polypeptide subunit release factors